MAREGHGDRSGSPKPLSEMLKEVGITDLPEEQQDAAVETRSTDDEYFRQSVHEAWDQPEYMGPTKPIIDGFDMDPAVRLECARIAGTSFGAAGTFDNDMLLRRAEAIFHYTKNGLE
jgi:hypothetical protein